ncbi:hypothetical protein PIB30_072780 [Stylosanthes scabra]|uniref:Uncharacterized protein n=1 Tax=Stylosanthes scabra TaxID=79078 RepID=A0ABU6QPQ3_9FABA|nr:hypothetical protein [Stylosanthes scabra]
MQKTLSQYLEELKSLRAKQDEMVNQQNNFYRQIKREQEKTIKEIEEQIREWTRNASSREAYCCWAHQQANSNLVEIPPHKIPDFLHGNVSNKKHAFYGALKSENQQGESSQAADQPIPNPPNP